MEKDISIIAGFLKTLDTYKHLHKIALLPSESNGVYKTYKVHYINNDNKKIKLRVELDFSHQKLSSGLWNDHSLKTQKFKHFL